jgi:hypothetical protein
MPSFGNLHSWKLIGVSFLISVIAGLVLPFWKEIGSLNHNMKVVRVSIGGKRIVGINVFPQSIVHVKALITKGIPQSMRIEQRLDNIPQCAFLTPVGPALVKHDCLSMNGVDIVQIKRDSSWAPDMLIFARCFEIPVLNQSDQVETPLHEVPWKDGPALYLNGQQVRVRLRKKAIAPLMLDQSLFCDQENELKVLSGNNRFFIVVQVGRRRSISEVCKLFQIISTFVKCGFLIALFCNEGCGSDQGQEPDFCIQLPIASTRNSQGQGIR